jgi:hypothetical protein
MQTVEEARKAAESRYRVNGKTVEAFHNGEWIVAMYCSSEDGAVECREKCIKRYIDNSQLSDDERRRRILR